jgi:hypothetical protein
MSQQQKKFHLLPFLHIAIILCIATWWGAFFWQHSPSRTILRTYRPSPKQESRVTKQLNFDAQLAFKSSKQIERVVVAARAGLADLSCGLGVLVLFAVGTGVYVRRFDTWLNARSSGQAVEFRGQDLTTAALDANVKKQRGIIK